MKERLLWKLRDRINSMLSATSLCDQEYIVLGVSGTIEFGSLIQASHTSVQTAFSSVLAFSSLPEFLSA